MKYALLATHLNSRLREMDRNPTWLARRLKLHPATVTRWCAGETRPGTPELTVRLADVLGFSDSDSRQRLLMAAGYGYAPADSPPLPPRPAPALPPTALPPRPLPYPRPLHPLDLPPPLAARFERMRQQIREWVDGALQAIALWRLDALEWTFRQQQPDVAWMEANVSWFQRNLPDLLPPLIAILWHPIVVEMIWHAGEATYNTFQHRLGMWQPPE